MTTLEHINKLCKLNPLNAGFIAQAVIEYANNVLENREQVMIDLKNGLIDGESWIECARQVKEEFK